jgi:hypothetical protein
MTPTQCNRRQDAGNVAVEVGLVPTLGDHKGRPYPSKYVPWFCIRLTKSKQYTIL